MNLPPHFLQNAVKSPILRLSSNADASLFASAETDGWRIWKTSTLEPVARKGRAVLSSPSRQTGQLINLLIPSDTPDGSLSLVLPLERSNIIFLVGGPPSPLYSGNKVIVYSQSKGAVIATLEFDASVLGLTARRDRLAVILKRRIHLFALPRRPGDTIKSEGTYDTVDNPLGLGCMASTVGSTLLCFPGRQAGQIAIVKLPPLTDVASTPSSQKAQAGPFQTTSIVLAHETALAALCITPDGRSIATASAKGTLIRLFDARTGKLIKELRRGADPARIFSLALKPDASGVACASDKGTIHIFNLHSEPRARRTSLDRDSTDTLADELKPFLPKYFQSTWSDAQYKLPPPEPQSARTVPFLGDLLAEEKPERPLTVEEDPVLCCWTFDDKIQEWVLCAITQSGGWFKIALLGEEEYQAVKEAKARAASMHAKGKHKASSDSTESKRPDEASLGAHGRCKLVQYSRFEQRDGW